jgi:hypothetical protein
VHIILINSILGYVIINLGIMLYRALEGLSYINPLTLPGFRMGSVKATDTEFTPVLTVLYPFAINIYINEYKLKKLRFKYLFKEVN